MLLSRCKSVSRFKIPHSSLMSVLRAKLYHSFSYCFPFFVGLRFGAVIRLRFGDTNCRAVYLDDNGFSGPLPPSLGNIISLMDCRLYSNKFQANIPTTLGNLVNLSKCTIDFVHGFLSLTV